MTQRRPAFAGLLGFRRSRRNFLGNQARLVLVEDGAARVLRFDGHQEEGFAVAEARIELRRGMLRVALTDREFFLYGISRAPIPDEALARVAPGAADVVVAPAAAMPVREALDAAAASRAAHEALLALGARPA